MILVSEGCLRLKEKGKDGIVTCFFRGSIFVLRQTLSRFLRFDASIEKQLNSAQAQQSGISLRDVVADSAACTTALLNAGVPLVVERASAAELVLVVGSASVRVSGLVADVRVGRGAEAANPPPQNQQPPKPLDESVHFARDFLSQNHDDSSDDDDGDNLRDSESSARAGLGGATTVARTIDSILNAFSFAITDATFRIHIDEYSIELKIGLLEYKQGPPMSSKKSATSGGISGVLARIANKQLSFKGISLKILQQDVTASSPCFESSLFMMQDDAIENLIKINVKQDLGLGPDASMMANSMLGGPTPVWDIDISIETMVYSVLDIQTLACLKAIMLLLSAYNNKRDEDTINSDTSPSHHGSFEDDTEKRSDTFRIQLRIPTYTAFLMYTSQPLSQGAINLLLTQNEAQLASESLDHLKFSITNPKLIISKTADNTLSLGFDIAQSLISEFVSLSNHSLDMPIGKYTPIVTVAGKAASKLSDRVDLLYRTLDDLGAPIAPESLLFKYAGGKTVGVSGGMFGGHTVDGGVSGIFDLSRRSGEVRVGEVVGVGELRQSERISRILKEFWGIGGQSDGNEESDGSEGSEIVEVDSSGFHVDLSIGLVRIWGLVPASKLFEHSRNAVNNNKLVVDVIGTQITINDPSSKSYKVGNNVINASTNIKFDGLGLSLAVPVTLWKEYKLTPLLYLSNTTIAVQTMAPHLISMAETVYFDGNEGYSDNDEDEDEEEFGYKSWLNIDGLDSLDNIRAKLAKASSVKESAILKARSSALSNSKTALIIHVNRVRIGLGKSEFDALQLLVNDLQLLGSSGQQPTPTSDVNTEETDSIDLSHMPFPFSLVLRADEIGIRLFDASEGNGAVLDWAYVIQMAETHVVFISKAGGDMEAHVEMDTISLSNMEGQAVLLRSEVLKEKRPMISVSFKSIYDSMIHMKENTVAVAISELRVVVVDSILASLAKDFSAFLKEPAGLTPIELVDAVTKVSLILNGAVLDYRPMYRSFRATVALKRVKLLLNMIPHSPTFGITVTIHDFALHLLKSSSSISFEIDEPRLMIDKGLVEYLRQCRYAQVLSCDLLEVSFRQTKGLDSVGRTEVEVSNGYAYLDVCMDSYRLLMDILGYIGEGGDGQYNSDRDAKIVGEKGVGIDLSNVPDMDVMMESVDETAFAKFVPLTQKPSREYNESEVQGADVFDGAISISDPQAVSQKAEILVYDNGPFEYYEDFFSLTGTPGGIEDITVPDKVPPLIHIKVKDVNVILRMFDGFDFPIRDFPDDDSDIQSNHPLEDSMMDHFESGSSVPSPSTAASHTLESRSAEARIQVNVTKATIETKSYPNTSVCASDLFLSINLIEVIDNVTSSMWRKFMTVMQPAVDENPVETDTSMIVLELVKVRPRIEVPEVQEIRLKVNCSPLRFYVDQDALSFIGAFVSYGPPPPSTPASPPQNSASNGEEDDSFFQMCSIRPIPVMIDYKPKHVNIESLRGGNLLEVFNFVPLEGAEMTLNQVRLNGVKGIGKLINMIKLQWLRDVTKNQPHRVVKGLSGIKPIASIGAGIADLILLPWQQYQREGKIMRGLEKGAKSFSKAAAMETLALGARLAITTQTILEGVEKNTTGRKPSFEDSSLERNKSRFSEQPKNIQEGVAQGAQSLARNVNEAVQTVLDVPARGLQGDTGRAAAAARAVPVAILRPVIGATEAVSKTLLGLQNTIDPSKKKQTEDKYKN